MGGRKAQAGGGLVVRGAGLDARRLQLGQHILQQGLEALACCGERGRMRAAVEQLGAHPFLQRADVPAEGRSEEHTSELQSPCNLVCRLLLEKKKKQTTHARYVV